MKDSEILTQAQALIDTPEKWVKGNFCVAKKRVDWDTETVTVTESYCIEGAVRHVLEEIRQDPRCYIDTVDRLSATLAKVASEMVPGNPVGLPRSFNDAPTTTHEDVMALMDKTRLTLEEQGR